MSEQHTAERHRPCGLIQCATCFPDWAASYNEAIRSHRAAERLRIAVAEHAQGPDCGSPDCLMHRHAQPGTEV